MDDPKLKVISYWEYPDRFALISEWMRSHGRDGLFIEEMLPKLAVIVTANDAPVAFLSCDLSNSVGKATLEFAITAPGQTAYASRRALQFGKLAIFSLLGTEEFQYGIVQTYTSPAVARTLERDGWQRVGENLVHLIKSV